MQIDKLRQEITAMLPVAREINDDQNLISAGINSLMVMRFVSSLRKEGIKISYGELLEEPTIAAWHSLIEKAEAKKSSRKKKSRTDRKNAETPDARKSFPLTDIQYAYKIGREDGRELGGVGCHAFMEFSGVGIDAERLDAAWKKVQYHHPMLRARFLDNGEQEIMTAPYSEHIDIYDLSNDSDWMEKCAAIGEKLTHRRFEVEKGHVCAFTLVKGPNDEYRLFYDVDLLVADVQSFNIILRDLAAAYKGRELPEDSLNWDFGAYLENKKIQEAEDEAAAKEYWSGRIADIALAPELPLAKDPSEITTTRTVRDIVEIPLDTWNKATAMAAKYNITPAIYLMTVYAMIIAEWSSSKRFLINIPTFDRHTEYGASENAVADFTTLMLLEVDLTEDPTFEELAMQIKKRLSEEMKYTAYSGVKVQRDIMSSYGEVKNAAPVVFACNFGNSIIGGESAEVFGRFERMLSQTPGVWIDFQSYETPDSIMLSWDSVVGLFPDGMINDMMGSMEQLIISTSEKNWNEHFDLLPPAQRKFIEEQKDIVLPQKQERLFDGFLRSAEKYPDKTALIDTGAGITMSYRELKEKALAVAGYFISKGIKGEAVAVTVTRGFRQAVALTGIILSGNSYVPVSIDQPKERRKLIHEKTDIGSVICDELIYSSIEWPESTDVLVIEELMKHPAADTLPDVSCDAPAYVIMTSGTTGLPKGAQMFHKGPANTIRDVNERYGITADDKVLGISSIDFDLSVYDFFGTFSASGTLVMIPDDRKRDAEYWLELVLKYNVTVWNSVPILLNMLMTAAEAGGQKLPLKRIMLSGDWIGLDLAVRADALTDDCLFISMGGATEASIWSNFYRVTLPLDESWPSIPYGRPLSGQSYRIVDDSCKDVPFWCEGELLIGGIGVGIYKGDDKLNSEKFIEDSGTRWYKTGDHGRFRENGLIEFLGRKDFQVKIRGHRIELGEAEAVLRQVPQVNAAAVEAAEVGMGEKHLVAFLETGNLRNAPLFRLDAKAEQESEKVLSAVSSTDISADGYDKAVEYSLKKVLSVIYGTVKALGILDGSFDSVDEQYRPLAGMYVDALCKNGIIKKTENGYESCSDADMPSAEGDAEKAVEAYFDEIKPSLPDILSGSKDAAELFYDPDKDLSPNSLLERLPGSNAISSVLADSIAAAIGAYGRKVNIIEVGARDTALSSRILDTIGNMDISYTIADISAFFLTEADKLRKAHGCCVTKLLNENDMSETCGSFDIVIAANYLHRQKDMGAKLRQLDRMLSASGVLFILEVTDNNALQWITADILEKRRIMLPCAEDYKALLKAEGADVITELLTDGRAGRTLIMASSSAGRYVPDKEYIISQIDQKLPEYMIPKVYYAMDKLPLSKNGKVDRKLLRKMASSAAEEKSASAVPVTETEKKLCKLWQEIFGMDNIGTDDNYYRLGGDSLTAIRMTTRIKKMFGIEYTVRDMMKDVTIAVQADKIDRRLAEGSCICTEDNTRITADVEHASDPFPLTEVQNAYLLGRSGTFSLGGVATHCYFELDGEDLDISRAQASLNDMIKYHGTMRLVISYDGTQRILPEVPEYHINTVDLDGISEADLQTKLASIREEMSHQVIDIEKWPLFDIRAAVFGGRFRIFVSFDNIVFDGFSMFGVLDEWAKRYKGTFREDKPMEITFRDYVLGLENIRNSGRYEKDKAYWTERIDGFLPAPALPTVKKESEITDQHFERHSTFLSKSEWDSLRESARRFELTPSVLLIAAYTETLRSRSSIPEFTLNLTQFDRKPLHPDVNKLFGDFTTLTLLEIRNSKQETFAERAQKIARQLARDLEHSCYSAVDLERELRHKTGNSKDSLMPVVFTSGIGLNGQSQNECIGELTYNISQTPQVWLDHQVVERDGGLCLSWDSLKDIFYPGFIDEMFGAYISLLRRLASDSSLFDKKSHSLIEVELGEARKNANMTHKELPEDTLDGMFLKAAEKYPDNTALECGKDRYTYRRLKARALGICSELRKYGVKQGETVAILMPKCAEQIIAALGILLSGGAYLPLDISNPDDRLLTILSDSGTNKIVYKDLAEGRVGSFSNYKLIDAETAGTSEDGSIIAENAPSQLAYVIYTSGSTGIPKGVMIPHSGAVNTIEDINSRFDVSQSDACLAISNMHFDLSVYDVFGLLAAGGKIVVPESDRHKDPEHWIELVENEHITLWNSVPAFAEMLCEYLNGENFSADSSLRLMLLSGDWISTTLPERIWKLFPKLRFVSLGGATEASIWSNIYEVTEKIPESWTSIPYGKPLYNQRYYILDEYLANRPDRVAGTIFIAGKGVAMGYLNDSKKTREKFIIHPVTGEYMYNTGDMGRYWSDGNIEFLGRLDNQIKINGYRVEIGEIEAAVGKLENVSDGKILFRDGMLIAFFRYNGTYTEEAEGSIKKALHGMLPAYMVPGKFVHLEEFPLTSNGKIDTAMMYEISRGIKSSSEKRRKTPLSDGAEKQIAPIWERVLGYSPVYADDDFFIAGGDSLKAIYLVNGIKKDLGIQISVKEVFTCGSLAALAKVVEAANTGSSDTDEDEFEI